MHKNKHKHDIDTVTAKLKRKGAQIFVEKNPIITQNVQRVCDITKADNVGIKTLGMVDYLMNHCGYVVYFPKPDCKSIR
jgi:hypothetical protein